MWDWVAFAILLIKEWAERDFVVPGVEFDIILSGYLDTPEFRRAYFKIQYSNGEINEGEIFEARYDKKTQQMSYFEFQTRGLEP